MDFILAVKQMSEEFEAKNDFSDVSSERWFWHFWKDGLNGFDKYAYIQLKQEFQKIVLTHVSVVYSIFCFILLHVLVM